MQPPIEVFETVIDEASDNPASLRLLSLTCSTFLPRARYHLFSRIIIRSMQQLEASPQLLDSCPWLLPLVRKVTLSVSIPEDNTLKHLPLLDVVPVHLLSNLPNLRSWTMEIPRRERAENSRPCLLLHRSALWRYQKYGGDIRDLELINIFMENVFDFMGLLSAFNGVRALKCSRINYRRWRDLSSPDSLRSATNTLTRLESLAAGPHLDITTIQYLLASSAATRNHLVVVVQSPKRVFCSPDYPELWEVSMSQLSHLSSLVLRILAHDQNSSLPWEWADHNFSITYDVRLTTRILKCLKRNHLGDVRIQLELEPVGTFGRWLSIGNSSLEACKALEEELLTFPSCGMNVFDAKVVRRSGRTEFWSSAIHGAFPKLNERGLFTFTRSKESEFIYSSRSGILIGHLPVQTNILDPLGHEGIMTCLVASRDNQRIVTASVDGTIIVWHANRGAPIQEWFLAAPVCSLALSPDGQRLLSVLEMFKRDDPLIVWDIGDGNVGSRKIASLEIEGHTECACSTSSWSSHGALIALVFMDGTMWIWDAQRFQWCDGQMNLSPRQTGALSQFAFCPNSHYLAWISSTPTLCYVSQPFTETLPVIYLEHTSPHLANPEYYVTVTTHLERYTRGVVRERGSAVAPLRKEPTAVRSLEAKLVDKGNVYQVVARSKFHG